MSTDRRASNGRHELGQNFLVDRRVVRAIVDAVPTAPALPVLELGAGDGAVTAALADSGHIVIAVELDPRRAGALRHRRPDVTVMQADMLTVRADRAHVVVCNVPFGVTTALLRHLLRQERWQAAVLLVQWEVARKRVGVGGATLLTAQWWPWVEFTLKQRVSARAFRPVPSVDGGAAHPAPAATPARARTERRAYQHLVRQLFDVGSVAAGLQDRFPRRAALAWLARQGLRPRALARDLVPEHRVALHTLASSS